MNTLQTSISNNINMHDYNMIKVYLTIRAILSIITILFLLFFSLCFISLSKELNSMTEAIKHYTYHTYNCCHYFGN